jgi:subtilisin family serine protease
MPVWLVILRLSALTWVLLLSLGCPGRLAPTAGPPAEGPGVPKQLQARQIIVTLPPASPERWAQLAATLGQVYDLPQVGAFPLTALGIQCVVFQVPADRSLDEVLARLAADPRVEAVQRNQQFQGLAVVHNDYYAPLQYGAQLIRADLAHRWATGRGVHVAIIDTGVETAHPDLQGQIGLTATFVEGGEQTFDQESPRHGGRGGHRGAGR